MRTPDHDHDWAGGEAPDGAHRLIERAAEDVKRSKAAARRICNLLGITEPWAGEPLPNVLRRIEAALGGEDGTAT